MKYREEELKAIERLDRLTIGTIIQTTDIDNASLILHDKIILLNLISKQQKETSDNYFKYIKEKNKYDKLLVLYNKQKEEIEILTADLREMTISNEHKKKEWMPKSCLNGYVSKDKIRELRNEDNIDYVQFKLKELLEE